jgi:hypothetical protein
LRAIVGFALVRANVRFKAQGGHLEMTKGEISDIEMPRGENEKSVFAELQ